MALDERRSDRRKVVLMATINRGLSRTKVRVSNVSAHGALVFGADVPSADEEVQFCCNGRSIHSWVAWSNGGYAGIQFAETVKPAELIQGTRGQAIEVVPDARTISHRRPGFRGNQLTDEERAIIAEWHAPA